MDQRWLLHSSCQHLFGVEDDKWLVLTGCRYSLLRGLLAAVSPSCRHSFGRLALKDDKRLEPTGCWHWLWREKDK